MKDIPQLLAGIAKGPALLRHLLAAIPADRIEERRLENHWNIRIWAAHLCSTQEMLIGRFKKMVEEDSPPIPAHLPDFTKTPEGLLEKDLEEWLQVFTIRRKEMLDYLHGLTPEEWQRPGNHQEYEQFSPYILLRHVSLVDHVHFFNIEKLWLTRAEYLK